MSDKNSSGFLSDDSWIIKTMKVTQVVLVGLCVVVLLILLGRYGVKVISSVDLGGRGFIKKTNTTGTVSPEAKQLADSLIWEIQKQEKLLEKL